METPLSTTDVNGHGDGFNFIITTYRNQELLAKQEAIDLISQLAEHTTVTITKIKGLIIGISDADPREISRLLHASVLRDPFSVRRILRFIPIDINCRTDVREIELASLSLLPKLDRLSRFRITVERRFSSVDSKLVIGAIAKHIDNPVDLEDPQLIVLVEILGGIAGISIIRPGDIFSALKAKLG